MRRANPCDIPASCQARLNPDSLNISPTPKEYTCLKKRQEVFIFDQKITPIGAACSIIFALANY
jgi:hypothetical protein